MTTDSDPDIHLGTLSIWVISYQYSDCTDYWDGNWLSVHIRCHSPASSVQVTGPCLHLPELLAWGGECHRLLDGEVARAALKTMEPNLAITVDRRARTFEVTVNITPDNVTETHRFQYSADQSEIARVIKEIDVVLARFPLRGRGPG